MPKLTMTRLNPGSVRVHGDIGIQAGDYTFTWDGADGPVEVDARFTFHFRREADGWKIVEHHSSAMPSAPAGLKAVSRRVLGLWACLFMCLPLVDMVPRMGLERSPTA